MDTLSLLATILMVMDPFGNLVAINVLLREMPPPQRQRVILRESGFALVILVLAALTGTAFLGFLGLESYSLSISGGIILFIIAIGMVFPGRKSAVADTLEDPFIVPIAMPLIAGPGTISVVLLFARSHDTGLILLCVLAACAVSTAILWVSPRLYALLGQRGAGAIERLTGMILVLMSVQMVLDGVAAYVQGAE